MIDPGPWLIDPIRFDALNAMSEAWADHEGAELFLHKVSSRERGEEAFILTGDVARVPVLGTLTTEPRYYYSLFSGGQTVYGDIIEGIRAAEADPDVKSIVLEVNSGGGTVAGFHEAATTIAATTKPITAEVTDIAASAAFGLAAATDGITVNSPMAQVGSVGAIMTQFTDTGVIKIRSSNAPLKQADASTKAGHAALQKELDELEGHFFAIIAEGRRVTVKTVARDFGRGAMVGAAAALEAGMIDAIREAPAPSRSKSPTDAPSAAAIQEHDTMLTLDELKAKHPEVFAAAVAIGTEAEQSRVKALVIMGKGFKAMDEALKFISEGKDVADPEVHAAFTVAGVKAHTLGLMAEDDKETEVGPAPKEEKKKTDEERELVFEHAVVNEARAAAGLKPLEAY